MSTSVRVAAALCLAAASASAQTAADLVFTNAAALTMNDAAPTAEAVAVIGNEIAYVGDAAGVEAFIGDGTEVFDLEGRTLLPGFVSGHDHIIASSWTSRGVSLFGVTSINEALARIEEYAEANPDEELVLGYGFNAVEYGRYPTAAELDEAVPDRPAFILDFTIHDAWLNTAAFEAGGVPEDDPDQVPETIFWIRGDDGVPTGVGIEFQWAPAFLAAGGWRPEEDIPDIQRDLYDRAARAGMTAVHVPGVASPTATNFDLALKDMEAAMAHLARVEAAGELKLRTFMATMVKDVASDAERAAEFTAELRERFDSDLLRVWGIKIHPEGNWSSKTSWMVEPFSDGSGARGGAAIQGELMQDIVLEANRRGLAVGIHVDGSQTVRNAVDAFLASNEAGHGVPHNVLHHYFWVRDEEHERVVENDIMVNITPLFSVDWEAQDRNALNLMGRARVEAFFARYSELQELGHNVSLSSDVPSSPPELIAPLYNVEIAMTLQDPDNPESRPFPPGRTPATLEEALKAVTIYPALQQDMGGKIGTLEVGKLADLVVLDDDITTVDPRSIAKINVLGTVMDGRFTYRGDL